MIPYSAVSIHSTYSRTWVHTLLLPAGLVSWTILVDLTFRSTVGWGSKHAGSTGTITSISIISWRVGIAATRIGITRIIFFRGNHSLRFESAFRKRISNVSFITSTGWYVVSNLTAGIDATDSRTRVNAFVSLACFVGGTVRVYNTFRSTCYIGISKVFRYTLAGCCSVSILTNSIGTTGSWITWVNFFYNSWTS